jgi:hypothetical protein
VIRFEDGKWENLDGMGEDILREMRPKAEGAMVEATVEFVNQLKLTLTGTRTGQPYKVSKTGRMHIASAPGEPPAVLFGNLRNSMGRTPPKWEGWTLNSEVGTGLGVSSAGEIAATYSRILEYGGFTKPGTYIAKRPYMQPTADRMEPKITAIFEARL